MNKKRIESYLPYAVDALKESGIAKNGKIQKAFRGQISSFGGAITMGSFKAAVAFFSEDSGNADSKVGRSKLIEAIWLILVSAGIKKEKMNAKDICSKILKMDDTKALAENFIDASIALKLAMNAYVLTEDNTDGKSESSV